MQKPINLEDYLIQYSQPKAFHLKSNSTISMRGDRIVTMRVMDIASVCAITVFDPSTQTTNIQCSKAECTSVEHAEYLFGSKEFIIAIA